ncbi:hypothetical protein G7077_13215 [Sphingomonas piscis]|uniref:Uncharacterized protein n=1 Tax=Sphingomonas piscis TaxID=2714943 RepID=A0A6G7YSK8_9SPHN|nr:hypothetical protein [Sphingomonas piscis]QIK79719.1 hypothetical protein G7077_13215 [Sphingomonas piscis]
MPARNGSEGQGMALNRSADRPQLSIAEAQLARVHNDGCARHPHLSFLLEASGPNLARDLSDAVHLMCSLHGRHPGMFDLALQRESAGPLQSWLGRAADAFERERNYLVRLTASVGPVPSTPGAAETESSMAGQRRALETLAMSERPGCALGAATAMVGDWWPIRRLLDRAAARAGVDCPPPSMPDEGSVRQVIADCIDTAAAQRAVSFGAEQLLLQHRALFDLLEARASARGDF